MVKRHSRTSRLARRRAGVRGGRDPQASARMDSGGHGPGDRRAGLRRCSTSSASGATSCRDFSGRAGALRHARGRQRRSWSSASSSAINYLAERQNKRWDLTAASQYTLSDQTQQDRAAASTKPVKVTVFARTDDFERFRYRLEEYQYHLDPAEDRLRRSREAAVDGGPAQGERARHDRAGVRRPRAARHVRRRTGHHQRR